MTGGKRQAGSSWSAEKQISIKTKKHRENKDKKEEPALHD